MSEHEHFFLQGGGEMGRLTRNFGWEKTILGAPSAWPHTLKTAIALILRSQFPMFLYWGKDLICFYNDAFRPSLGKNGKHPALLGMPAKHALPETWDIIHPFIQQVLLSGESFLKKDQIVPIFRNGTMEAAYWTFSYTPVSDETGGTAAVLVTCIETTEKIRAFNELEESHQQLRFAIEAAELGTFDYNPQTDKFIANSRLKKWFGLPDSAEIALPLALASMVDEDRERVASAIAASFDPDTGGKYEIEYSLKAVGGEPERKVLAKGRVYFDSEHVAVRLSGTLQDITELRRTEKKRQHEKIREQQLIIREKMKAQETERNQLGIELHDNICQVLAAVKMKLSFISNLPQDAPIIQECLKYVNEALVETRDISHRMVKPRFAEIGLVGALVNLCNVYQNEKRVITVVQTGTLKPDLPVGYIEAIYRITQEQLHNMHKHSGATEVNVDISLDNNFIRLTIKDNGVGFHTSTIKTGIGLASIHDRAELLNGSAKITSSPGEGCILEVQIPLDAN